jgi:hypothetical protein
MSEYNSELDTNNMHLCGPQTNNGIHRLRKNNITGNDSDIDFDYIYKYNIMTKEYKRKKAKFECVCDLSKYIYGEKLLNNMNEDYTNVGYDYQDVLREIVLDELKQEKLLQNNL